MERLETVLCSRTQHFVRIFVTQFGFSVDRAKRFVDLAGDDLIECYRWQGQNLLPGEYSHPENVRNIMSVLHARGIADSLGMAPAEVWSGLRVFVPRVLQLADDRHPHQA
jgi:hypothetical protein